MVYTIKLVVEKTLISSTYTVIFNNFRDNWQNMFRSPNFEGSSSTPSTLAIADKK